MGSVIDGFVGRRVEEGGLQNSGRNADAVSVCPVEGIDRLRSIVPLASVNRLIQCPSD